MVHPLPSPQELLKLVQATVLSWSAVRVDCDAAVEKILPIDAGRLAGVGMWGGNGAVVVALCVDCDAAVDKILPIKAGVLVGFKKGGSISGLTPRL